MPYCRMVIDGKVELDEHVSIGQKRPPKLLADMIRPGGRNQPYMMAAAAALAEAVSANKAVEVTVTTRTSGWNIDVEHRHHLASVRTPELPAAPQAEEG